MALHIYPSSSFSSLREANDCHNPAGAPEGGGRFCKKTGKALIAQQFGKETRLPPGVKEALGALRDDESIPAHVLAKRMARVVREGAPELWAEAERLHAKGTAGQAEFEVLTRKLADQLGYDFHTNIESRDIFEKDVDWVVIGPQKKVERIAVKSAMDYEGDVALVKDVVRATIAVRSADDLITALQRLSESGVEILPQSFKDNVTRPLSTGYRDLNLIVKLPGSKMLAEVQIIVKPMLEAKMTMGHRLYEAWRVLDENTPRAQALFGQMSQLYGGAWARAAATASGAVLASLPLLIGRLRGS
jgi:hypothetical protein